jgi:arylsulfatase A-like enzyme
MPLSRLPQLALLIALALPFSTPPAAPATPAAQPNILVFLVDDLGPMDTSLPFLTDADGAPATHPLNHFYRTPNMERLAAQGIRFSQFYAMSVCSPSRISLLTGQNAARHRATNWINPDNNNAGPNGPAYWRWKGLSSRDITLPRLLQSAGYQTFHVGKAHFGPRDSEGAEPTNLGFDANIAGASFGAPGSYYANKNYGRGTPRSGHAVPHLEAYHGSDVFLSEALTIESIKLLTAAAENPAPFFFHLSHYAVHSPFEPDPRFAPNYADSDKSPQAKAFATLVEGIDKSLGDVLDHLQKLPAGKETLVLFLGDNGSDAPLGHQHAVASSAPLRGKKGAHYEGGMRTPLIAAWATPDPDHPLQQKFPIPHGAIQPQLASIQDLFPTILALTSTPAPPDHAVDGTSLLTLFSGQHDPAHPGTFLMHYPHQPHRSAHFTVWRDGDWKVIYHYFPSEASDDSHYQLFNLATDPFEQSDLAKAEPEQLTRLMRGLIQALDHHHALYPTTPDNNPLKPKLP